MTRYSVVPAGNSRGNWKVEAGGRTVSVGHRTKSGAKREAKSRASGGDTVVLHRSDGTIQRSKQIRS
jgi:hypothetical protein